MNIAVIAVILVTVLPAFLVSVVAVGWVARHAQRLGLLDRPNARKVHTTPIPLGGGLGIWIGLVAVFATGTLATWVLSSNPAWMRGVIPENISVFIPGLVSRMGSIWFLIVGGTILMALGLLDDRFGLDWKLRLLVEFGVASAVVYGQHLQLTAYINAPWLTSVLSVFWIVMLINHLRDAGGDAAEHAGIHVGPAAVVRGRDDVDVAGGVARIPQAQLAPCEDLHGGRRELSGRLLDCGWDTAVDLSWSQGCHAACGAGSSLPVGDSFV
jgi:hypothetical protein